MKLVRMNEQFAHAVMFADLMVSVVPAQSGDLRAYAENDVLLCICSDMEQIENTLNDIEKRIYAYPKLIERVLAGTEAYSIVKEASLVWQGNIEAVAAKRGIDASTLEHMTISQISREALNEGLIPDPFNPGMFTTDVRAKIALIVQLSLEDYGFLTQGTTFGLTTHQEPYSLPTPALTASFVIAISEEVFEEIAESDGLSDDDIPFE